MSTALKVKPTGRIQLSNPGRTHLNKVVAAAKAVRRRRGSICVDGCRYVFSRDWLRFISQTLDEPAVTTVRRVNALTVVPAHLEQTS